MSSSESDGYNNYYISESDDYEPIMVTIRNLMDGAENVDDMINRLNTFIDYLRYLKDEGWQLQAPIVNDTGFLSK